MKNIMEIDGYKAVTTFNPDTNQFRGEFINRNGGADFYAADVQSLRREGEISLKVFLDMCAEDAVESRSSAKPADFQRPPAESLRNASAIWESVADSLSQIAMTPLQQQELDARYVDYLAHPEDGESWPTVKSQILQSR